MNEYLKKHILGHQNGSADKINFPCKPDDMSPVSETHGGEIKPTPLIDTCVSTSTYSQIPPPKQI